MPLLGPVHATADGGAMDTHPAHAYLHKTQALMKKGYSEQKAYDMVGVEMDAILQKRKDEQRILRGVALDTEAYSYVDRF